MRAYSIDLRERIVRAVQSGKPLVEVSRIFEVGISTIKRYLARAKKTGELAPRFSPGRPRQIKPDDQIDLVAQLESFPDLTLAEHCQRWKETHGASVSVSTITERSEEYSTPLKKDTTSQ